MATLPSQSPTATCYVYGVNNCLTTLTHTHNGALLARYAYTLDATGNRTRVTETVDGVTREISYTYDSLYRLTAADYSTGEAYAYQYDPVGNRTAMTDTAVHTYAYDAANRLTNADGVVHTWDNRGNLLADGTFTYTYSAAGRMVQAQNLTATLVYTYNADGLRVAQSQSVASVQSVDTFTWDWATGVPELLSDGESLYLIGYDTLGWQSGVAWTFVLPDALGSVRQESDAAGAVMAVREWSPYGEEVGGAQTGLGFTGEWFDTGVGLQYLRARWYAPINSVFVSRDPVESEPPYQYVRGNPIRWTDSSGCIIDPTKVGTEYFYSCKCGWIDTSHTGSTQDLIKAVRNIGSSNPMSTPEWQPYSTGGGQFFFSLSADFLVRREGVINRRSANEVALAIHTAYNNFWEVEGQGSNDLARLITTFSEEDLVSDLIGYHRGLLELENNWPSNDKQSLEHFMKVCEVVGYEYYDMSKHGKPGFMDAFILLQTQIYWDYLAENGFRKHDQWGIRSAGRWSGEVTLIDTDMAFHPLDSDPTACLYSFSCDKSQEQLPTELVSVTPQSPGQNWIWKSGRLQVGKNVTNFEPEELNNRSLNWSP